MNRVTVDIGESHVTAAKAVGELGMVNAHQMQHRGMEIVNRKLFLDDPVPIVVSRSDHDSPLDATASHPHRIGLWVVVSAISPLSKGRSTKLARPDN